MTTELDNSPSLTDLYDSDRTDDLADSADDLATRLRSARDSAGLTPEELAVRLGATVESVLAWEAGERSPRSDRVSKLAGILGVSISWLLVGHGETTATPESGESPREMIAAVREQLAAAAFQLSRIEQRLDASSADAQGESAARR